MNFPRPIKAIWDNKDHDAPVEIIGEFTEPRDGVKYFQSADQTGIPETELDFDSGE